MSLINRFPGSASPPSLAKESGSFKTQSGLSSLQANPRSASVSIRRQRNQKELTMKKVDSLVTIYRNGPIRVTYLPPDSETKSTSLLFEANNNSQFITWKRIPLPGDQKCNFSVASTEIRFLNKAQNQLMPTPVIAIFGGRSSSSAASAQNEKNISNLILFNISSGVCSSVTFFTNEPSFRYGHAMIANRQKLYIFGGFNGKTANNELLIINMFYNRCTCTTITQNNVFSDSWPSARSAHTLTKIESPEENSDKQNKSEKFKAYMFGGIEDSGKLCGELWELTCLRGVSPRWKLVSQTGPPPRYGHIAYMKNGDFYVAGGYDASGKPLNDIWMFEPGKRQDEKIRRRTSRKEKQQQKEVKPHNKPPTGVKTPDVKTLFSQSAKGIPTESKPADSSFSKDDSQIDLSASQASSSEFILSGKTAKNKSDIPNRSNGKWTQIAVFKPDPSLFSCDGNLFITDPDTKAIQRLSGLNTLALIDDKFEKMTILKGDQNEMKEGLKKAINDFNEKQQEFKKLTIIRNLLTDPNPKFVADGEMMGKAYFDPHKIGPLNNRITALRKEFVNQAVELVDRHINVFCIEDKDPENITEDFVKEQMQELTYQTEKYRNRMSELKTELDILNTMVSNQTLRGTPNFIDAGYKSTLDFSMKNIEYHSLKQREMQLMNKIERTRDKINKNETRMIDIFEKVEVAEEDLKHESQKKDKWDFRYQDASSQILKSETMIELIGKPNRELAMKQKINQLEKNVNDLTIGFKDVINKTLSASRSDTIRKFAGLLKMIKIDIPFATLKADLTSTIQSFNSEPIPAPPKREQEDQVLLQLPKEPEFPMSFLQQLEKKHTTDQKQAQQQSTQRKIMIQQMQNQQQTTLQQDQANVLQQQSIHQPSDQLKPTQMEQGSQSIKQPPAPQQKTLQRSATFSKPLQRSASPSRPPQTHLQQKQQRAPSPGLLPKPSLLPTIPAQQTPSESPLQPPQQSASKPPHQPPLQPPNLHQTPNVALQQQSTSKAATAQQPPLHPPNAQSPTSQSQQQSASKPATAQQPPNLQPPTSQSQSQQQSTSKPATAQQPPLHPPNAQSPTSQSQQQSTSKPATTQQPPNLQSQSRSRSQSQQQSPSKAATAQQPPLHPPNLQSPTSQSQQQSTSKPATTQQPPLHPPNLQSPTSQSQQQSASKPATTQQPPLHPPNLQSQTPQSQQQSASKPAATTQQPPLHPPNLQSQTPQSQSQQQSASKPATAQQPPLHPPNLQSQTPQSQQQSASKPAPTTQQPPNLQQPPLQPPNAKQSTPQSQQSASKPAATTQQPPLQPPNMQSPPLQPPSVQQTQSQPPRQLSPSPSHPSQESLSPRESTSPNSDPSTQNSKKSILPPPSQLPINPLIQSNTTQPLQRQNSNNAFQIPPYPPLQPSNQIMAAQQPPNRLPQQGQQSNIAQNPINPQQRHQSQPPHQQPNQPIQRTNPPTPSQPQQMPIQNRTPGPISINPNIPYNAPPNMQHVPNNMMPIPNNIQQMPGSTISPNLKPAPGNIKTTPNMNPSSRPPNLNPMNPINLPPNMPPINPANLPPNVQVITTTTVAMPPNMIPNPNLVYTGRGPPNMQAMPPNMPQNMRPVNPGVNSFGPPVLQNQQHAQSRPRSTSINSMTQLNPPLAQPGPSVISDEGKHLNVRANTVINKNPPPGLRGVPPPVYGANPTLPPGQPPNFAPPGTNPALGKSPSNPSLQNCRQPPPAGFQQPRPPYNIPPHMMNMPPQNGAPTPSNTDKKT